MNPDGCRLNMFRRELACDVERCSPSMAERGVVIRLNVPVKLSGLAAKVSPLQSRTALTAFICRGTMPLGISRRSLHSRNTLGGVIDRRQSANGVQKAGLVEQEWPFVEQIGRAREASIWRRGQVRKVKMAGQVRECTSRLLFVHRLGCHCGNGT